MERIVRKTFILYLIVFLFFFITRNLYFPAWYDAFMQVFMLLFGLGVLFLTKNNKQHILLSVLLYQLLCSFIMVGFNYEIYGDIYGYNPIDADIYRNFGNIFTSKDFSDALNYLKYNANDVDDYGYPLIIFFSKKLCNDYFLQFIVFANAMAVSIASVYLYGLSSLFLPRGEARVVALIWGIMPFSIYTTAAGLKENFFVLLIVLCFYNLYKYISHKCFYSLCFFLLFASMTFLFRLVVGYAIILSFISYIVFNNKMFFKHYKLIVIFSLIIIFFTFGYLAEFVINQRGYEYEMVQATASEKTGGLVGGITNILAGFIGPFPNFVSSSPEKITYITRYSFTPFFKMIISFYFLYAVYYIIKNKKTILFPMIILFVVNIIMLIFTFFTLHDRYQWPHIPVFLLLSAYGYMLSRQSHNIRKIYSYYLCVILLIIIVFNFR